MKNLLWILLACPALVFGQSVRYDATLQWTEPHLNEDGTPLTDLDRYELEAKQEAGGPISAAVVPAPNPAPPQNSTMSHTMIDLPVAGGDVVQFFVRACDGATDPQGQPANNCSTWTASNLVTMPVVDVTAPGEPTQVNVSVTVTVQ